MPKTKKAPAHEASAMKKAAARKCAILFELENVAVGARQMTFDVIKKAMADKGVKLTPALFSRYCLGQSLSQGVGELLELGGKARVSKDKFAADVIDDVKAMLLNHSPAVGSGLKQLLKRAVEKDMVVGALTCLDHDTALQLLGKLKLDGEVSAVLPYVSNDKIQPNTDSWLKLARTLSVTPGSCLAVVTSATSAKAALILNMKCVVIVDNLTQCHDFGGADCVADVLDEAVVDTIFSLLEDR